MTKDEEIIDCLQLINSENVGPVTFYKLLKEYKSLKAALEVLPRLKTVSLCPRSAAVQMFEQARAQKIQLISFKNPLYPQSLKQLNDAPPLLYVLGNPALLQHPLGISIVGARNASINGRKLASKIAFELTNNDILVASGMARGIDSSAHKGALYAKKQQGPTLAVLGTGVDVPYPNENKELYHQIIEQGVVISEFPLGSKARIQNFPRRNRLISALTSGTLVVEATLHSGSLSTARFALEQGKDIFAVPGSPQDGRALGPNKLIKDGAILVENADDILEVLSTTHHKQINEYVDKLQKNVDIPAVENEYISEPPASIIDYISCDGVYVDEIIRASGLDASEVSLALLELEMNGRIMRQVGNKVALIK